MSTASKSAKPSELTGTVISFGTEKAYASVPNVVLLIKAIPAFNVTETAVVLDISTEKDTFALAAFLDLGT